MKTLIESFDNSIHAIINSNINTKYDSELQEPIWSDKEKNLAETERNIGDVSIYQVDRKGNVKRLQISSHFLMQISDKIAELKSESTPSDYPEYR